MALARFAARIPPAAGLAAAATGSAVLLAWAFDVDVLKGPSGGATMKANTAVLFVVAGLAVATTGGGGVPSRAGAVLGLVATVVAAATLAEYVFGWNLGIDQLLVADDAGGSAPGRMSPMTALCFAALGGAIWTSRRPGRVAWREPLALVALLAAGVATVGYAYDTGALYNVGPYTSMAPHTAVLMTVLAAGFMAQHPTGGGLSSVLLGADIGGTTARRLLPWALATPVVVGWLTLLGQNAGLWGEHFGVALVVIATMVIVSVVVLSNARSLRTSEHLEQKAIADLRELTRTLEQRIEEKTHELSERQARFRALLESAPDAIVITNEAGIISLANRQAERLFGYSSDEFAGLPVDALLPQRFRAAHQAHRGAYGLHPRPRPMGVGLDLWAVAKNGAEFPVEVSLGPLNIDGGVLISTAIRDITGRRALEADRRRFVFLAEQSQDFIGMCDTSFLPFYLNEAGRRLVGLSSPEETRSARVADYFFPEDRPFIQDEFFPRVVREGHGAIEIRFRHFQTGHAIWMDYRVSTLHDERGQTIGWATISTEITARRQAEAALRASLAAKETLLREVHHRVKNNLAVIGSLFYLQSTYITDPALRHVLQESQERVRSMALVHERLYRSGDVAQVDFADYIRELAGELVRNYSTSAVSPRLLFDLKPMTLDLDRAVACGLILNEIISNALKHAFPDGRPGAVQLSLRETGGGFRLTVADDGVGLPPDAATRPQRSLGMRLMHALAAQVNGRLEFHDAEPGTEIQLTVEDGHARGE